MNNRLASDIAEAGYDAGYQGLSYETLTTPTVTNTANGVPDMSREKLIGNLVMRMKENK